MKLYQTAGLFLSLLLSGCTPVNGEKVTMKEKPQFIIDVRSQEEYAAGHLEGALLIPHTEIGTKIQTAVPEQKSSIVLYCRSGRRAGQAKEVMEKLGYKNITNLGGLEDAAQALNKQVVR